MSIYFKEWNLLCHSVKLEDEVLTASVINGNWFLEYHLYSGLLLAKTSYDKYEVTRQYSDLSSFVLLPTDAEGGYNVVIDIALKLENYSSSALDLPSVIAQDNLNSEEHWNKWKNSQVEYLDDDIAF